MQELLEKQAQQSRFDEVAPFLSKKRIRLIDAGSMGDSGDEMGEKMLSVLSAAASDSGRYLLTDEMASGLVEAMIHDGLLRVPDRAVRHAREVQMNAGLVQALPTLPYAPLDEVWEIRQELSSELGRYRSELTGLVTGIGTSPYASREFSEEIEERWLAEVSPAIDEINDALRASSRVKRLGKAVLTGAGIGATGQVVLGALSHVVFGWMPDPGNLLAGAGPMAGGTLAQIITSQRMATETRQMRFYFLQEADRRATRRA